MERVILNIFTLFSQYLELIYIKIIFFNRIWKINKERFGSRYGGWNVAIGHLTNKSIVYSFGIGEDLSFDIALIHRFGLFIHAFDPTPKSIGWVHKQVLPESFIFHDYGLGDLDAEVNFYPPDNPNHNSYSMVKRSDIMIKPIHCRVKRLEKIMKELGHNNIDLLKMDIEGAEYQVIDDILNANLRPIQILVEFHHRFPNIGFNKTINALRKLTDNGYVIFSVSPSGEEFGLIQKQ
jgi:FkbM family methyltransferase